MFFRYTFSLFLILSFFASEAQILDDSTELVYGPETVQVFYENDVKLNLDRSHEVDTSLFGLEDFWFVDRQNRKYQDLGNVGTALWPIFYQDEGIIGRTSGYKGYQHYNINFNQHRFFDTKSPFMDLFVVLGGHGRAVIDYGYSQNVTPQWNIGLNVNKMNVDKQIGAEQTEGDRNVDHTRGNFYTWWRHPEVDYQLMIILSGMTHKVDETGGIRVEEGATGQELFQYRDSNIRLNDARGIEGNIDGHLYQQFGLAEQLQIYHQLDVNRQRYTYEDNRGGSDETYEEFYDFFYLDEDSTFQESNFRSISNEAGVKGLLGSIYYRFWVKNRLISHSLLYSKPYADENENYLGAMTRFNWRDVFDIGAEGELLQSGEFRLQATLNSSLIKVRYATSRYKQSNMVRRYFGNHYQWNNQFDAGFNNSLSGQLTFKLGNFHLRPMVELRTLQNYVYFDTLSTPQILSDPALITRAGGRFNYFVTTGMSGSGFHFMNEVYYTLVNQEAESVIRIPDVFYAGRFYWEGRIFNKSVPFQTGFDLYAKSAYFANDYNPVLQTFFVQDQDELRSYITADFFLNMQVERFFLFAKVVYVNMAAANGYFVTPLYPGQERVVDVGVRWLFFD